MKYGVQKIGKAIVKTPLHNKKTIDEIRLTAEATAEEKSIEERLQEIQEIVILLVEKKDVPKQKAEKLKNKTKSND